jgi:hypothetical protein
MVLIDKVAARVRLQAQFLGQSYTVARWHDSEVTNPRCRFLVDRGFAFPSSLHFACFGQIHARLARFASPAALVVALASDRANCRPSLSSRVSS